MAQAFSPDRLWLRILELQNALGVIKRSLSTVKMAQVFRIPNWTPNDFGLLGEKLSDVIPCQRKMRPPEGAALVAYTR